jgi:hypothetical protein
MGYSGDCYVFGFHLLDYNHGEHHVRPGARAAEILTLSGFEGPRPEITRQHGRRLPARNAKPFRLRAKAPKVGDQG